MENEKKALSILDLDINNIQLAPSKEELEAKRDKYKDLTIKDINDNEGYLNVNKARLDLVHERTDLRKVGKKARDFCTIYRNAVIKLEDELVAIIEPTEKELASKQDAIDNERLIIKRQEAMPARLEKLKSIEFDSLSEEAIALMDDDEFNVYFNEQKSIYLTNKEAAMKAEQDKLDVEKKRIEDEKILEAEKKKAREEALAESAKQAKIDKENAKIKADKDKADALAKAKKDKEDALMEAKLRADKEKQDIIDAQLEKERKAKEEIENDKRIKAEAEAKARLDQERLDKEKKYKKFLADNNFVDGKDTVKRVGDVIEIWRKVAEFIIK